MVSRVSTVAFQGIEGVPVDVQVMVGPGKINMHIVGLPDKAVAESRERVQAALHASGLAMPPKKITVNLAPADLPKEGIFLPHLSSYPFSRSLFFRAKPPFWERDIDLLSTADRSTPFSCESNIR
ncbi:Hypothetical protein NGAL_HAMBI1145_32640 [Neorhizobium galegae bv. officinalis]|uniref:Uncharacterized protein n=1 Tax=Neorhizobium galegae bv. officinalis TaxID=323656 RepID=A0A0T7FMP6_NEOGA|nr:Hypothetical protein NGAL_HAMBI1145_32640 [Neorhizobium galegae bv. officinalis]